MNKRSLAIYTWGHFLVDFTCAYFIFTCYQKNLLVSFYLYNGLAFGLQVIFGAILDYIKGKKKTVYAAVLGFVFLLIALSFRYRYSLLGCALLGIGNALFHIGGGIDSLIYERKKMSRSGIFVSSGAIGVSAGIVCAGKEEITPFLFLILILTGILTGSIQTGKEEASTEQSPLLSQIKQGLFSQVTIVIAVCFLIILIRSFVGVILPMEWKQGILLSLLFGVFTCVGKAAGGILGDLFGAGKVGIFSLLASIPLLIFGSQNSFLSLLGICLFNMTMPIALKVLAVLNPEKEGTVFGINTLALLLGYFFMEARVFPQSLWKITTLVFLLLSAVGLMLTILPVRKLSILPKESRKEKC